MVALAAEDLREILRLLAPLTPSLPVSIKLFSPSSERSSKTGNQSGVIMVLSESLRSGFAGIAGGTSIAGGKTSGISTMFSDSLRLNFSAFAHSIARDCLWQAYCYALGRGCSEYGLLIFRRESKTSHDNFEFK